MLSLPAPSGSAIVLDPQLTGNKSDLSVDVAPNGDFAFAWLNGPSLTCAEYSAAGVAMSQNASFSWASGVYYPQVAISPTGNFVVAFAANSGASQQDVYFLQFNSSGQSNDIPVKVTTTFEPGDRYAGEHCHGQ